MCGTVLDSTKLTLVGSLNTVMKLRALNRRKISKLLQHQWWMYTIDLL